jgi:hypothetical protein
MDSMAGRRLRVRSRRRRDLTPRRRLALTAPAARGGEPPVGIGGDLDELLEGCLEARVAAAAQDDLLGEEKGEVAQLELWPVGDRTVTRGDRS